MIPIKLHIEIIKKKIIYNWMIPIKLHIEIIKKNNNIIG